MRCEGEFVGQSKIANLKPEITSPLHLGHSPDPDDAFMWWPLADFVAPDGVKHSPQIDTRGYHFIHVLEDIQSLNVRSEKGELEITALSIHQYPFVADRYALTSCGSSMGDHYGPMIVCSRPLKPNAADLKGLRLAMPGERTTAWLTCRIMLAELGLSIDDLDWHFVPFDQIIPRVAAGDFDAGLIIHEGQITYQNQQLHLVIDLGAWWTRTRNLPLPLGGNAIRRDLLESGQGPVICRVLLDSIHYALQHRADAVRFALHYARDMDAGLADRFVGMYVNQWTLDYGEKGRAAVRCLIEQAVAAGFVPDCGPIDFIEPEK